MTPTARYSVSDPVIALTRIERFQDAFHIAIQTALRDPISGAPTDEVVARRSEIGRRLFERAEPKMKGLGLNLKTADARSIMFPGNLKKAFM
jgi:regulator of protease activity HflC (stomatin/prohibitin superfamily)